MIFLKSQHYSDAEHISEYQGLEMEGKEVGESVTIEREHKGDFGE